MKAPFPAGPHSRSDLGRESSFTSGRALWVPLSVTGAGPRIGPGVEESPHSAAVVLPQPESVVVAVEEVPGLRAGVEPGVPVDAAVRLRPRLRADRAVDADVLPVLPGPGLGGGVGAELPVDEAGADRAT